jgi:hypothetical protein
MHDQPWEPRETMEPHCRECGEQGWLGICQECADHEDREQAAADYELAREEALAGDDHDRAQWLATLAEMESSR